MPSVRRERSNRRRRSQGGPAQNSPGHIPGQDPPRRQAWSGKSPHEVLQMYPPGKTPALRVLDVLIELFNTLHTSLEKTVSHKTRYERANFLRRFYRDLHAKAGFKIVPDPRNLGQRHVHAIVQVWQREKLAPATIQTYLSFLRGLALWLGKPGFIRKPAHYGLSLEEYQRHENAQRDKSWRGNGVDVDALLARACAYDARVGASMRLMVALGLRRKESVQCRPFAHVHTFAETGLPADQQRADRYLRVKGKGGRVRWLPLITEGQWSAIEQARSAVDAPDAHMGAPGRDLKANLRRLDYALCKFGLTKRQCGATGHGARHQYLQETYEDCAGVCAPICGGGAVAPERDRVARLLVSREAGHARARAAGAYLGPVVSPGRPGSTAGKQRDQGAPQGQDSDGSGVPVA